MDGVEVNLISLAHLKVNKKASGRYKDLNDLASCAKFEDFRLTNAMRLQDCFSTLANPVNFERVLGCTERWGAKSH